MLPFRMESGTFLATSAPSFLRLDVRQFFEGAQLHLSG
jgi:hypothetical protein